MVKFESLCFSTQMLPLRNFQAIFKAKSGEFFWAAATNLSREVLKSNLTPWELCARINALYKKALFCTPYGERGAV